jgi:hypothetical protein
MTSQGLEIQTVRETVIGVISYNDKVRDIMSIGGFPFCPRQRLTTKSTDIPILRI